MKMRETSRVYDKKHTVNNKMETESLKDLGVVMTQTNLDQYAMANGFGKTTAAMTEQEKVMLRYQYVMSSLSNAQGDFSRTSDSWANQTRILALNFQSLKAALGQSFIAVFKPVLQVINALLSKITALANKFKDFILMITGQTPETSGSTTDALTDATTSADGLSDSVSGVGDSASDTAKKVKEATKQLMGFDKINKLNDNSDDDSDSTSGSGTSSLGSGAGYTFNLDTTDAEKKISKLNSLFTDLANNFKDGFKVGLGDDFEASLERIKGHAESIKNSLQEIFTDQGVTDAAKNFANSLAYSLGEVAGSIVSAGQTIAENLIGGIDKYLLQNKEFIKSSLISIFDASAEIALKIGEISTVVARLFEVFRSDEAKQCTADLIGIFANSWISIQDICLNLGADVLDAISKPLIENKDKIANALENTISPLSTVIGTFKEAVDDTFGKIKDVCDKTLGPSIEKLGSGISEIFGSMLDVYNNNVAPTLSKIADGFKSLYEDHLKNTIGKVIELVGSIGEAIVDIWDATFKPFAKWIVETLGPIWSNTFGKLVEVAQGFAGNMFDSISGLLDALKGLVTFIKGAFTGDWKTAWNGIKEIFGGIWDAIKANVSGIVGIFTNIVSSIVNCFTNIGTKIASKFSNVWSSIRSKFDLGAIKTWFSNMVKSIADRFTNIGTSISSKFSSTWGLIRSKFNIGNIKTWFGNVVSSIVSKFSNVASSIGSKFSGALGSIKSKFSLNSVKSYFSSVWTGIKNVFSPVSNWFGDIFSKAWAKVKNVFCSGTTVFKSIAQNIADIFKKIVNSLITGINKVVSAPFKKINSILNSIRNTEVLGFKPFSGLWGQDPCPVPEIPQLAKGGIVDGSTIAEIGEDGREAVIPLENNTEWITQLAGKIVSRMNLPNLQAPVLKSVTGEDSNKESDNDKLMLLLQEILKEIKDEKENVVGNLKTIANKELTLDGKKITKAVVNNVNNQTQSTGKCPIVV